MAIASDFSIDVSGNIRYTGSGSNYTVLELKTWLGDLLDDAQASGNDLADITTSTIYERSTDEILTLNSPYNIDDTAAEHLYDGSITQDGGRDLYSGLYVVGAVEGGTEIMVVQDNKVLAAYWGTGINPDAAENVIMRIMVKTRAEGANINNRKVRVLARELGDKYAEFDVTLGTANATAAVFTSADLNNDTVEATIESWSSITNTEGFQEININGLGASGQEFYSQWNKGIQSLNDVYERTKWIAKRATVADQCTETGNDLTVDNATTTGIGAEFSARDNNQKLVEGRIRLKIGAGAPTGTMYMELFDSDDGTPPEPTGSVLATSESLNVNRLTSSYQEVIFRFNDNVTLTADQEYFLVIQHLDGTAGAYIVAEGDTSTADDGSYAYYATGTWTGTGTTQLNFKVKSCPIIHGTSGELFRGINVEVGYDNGAGTFAEDEIVVWGTDVTYDNLTGDFDPGMYVSFWNGSTQVNAGKVLYDNGSTLMRVMLEDISGATLSDGYNIKDVNAPTTNYAQINVTIANQNKAGGEGLILAHDDNTGTGELYMQVVSGANPVENLPLRGLTSAATADATAVINSRTISAEFVGQSTGSNIIGAYGIGFDPTDVGANDTFFDLSNTLRTPPNNVTFTVSGLVSSEDRVLVGPRTGSALNKAQYVLNTTLNAAAETAVVVTAGIQTETPTAGYTSTYNTRLRIELDTGIYRRQPYLSWATSTFTLPTPDTGVGGIQIDANEPAGTFTRQDAGNFLADGWDAGAYFTTTNFTNPGNNATWTVASVTASVITVVTKTGMVTEVGGGNERAQCTGWNYTDPNDASATNDVFVAYIDILADGSSESFTAVHGTNRDLLIRVRDGGATPIKTYEYSAQFTSSPQTVSINRVPDA